MKYCNSGDTVDVNAIMDGSRSLEEEVAILVDFCDAARYFELDSLKSTLESKISSFLSKGKVRHMWPLLAGLLDHGEDDGELWQLLVNLAVENPRYCCEPTEWGQLAKTYHPRPDILAEVLRRSKDTKMVIRCLEIWFTRESLLEAGGNAQTLQTLRRIAQEVDLTQISIFELSKIQTYFLFSVEKIEEAVEHYRNTTIDPSERTGRVKEYCVFGSPMVLQ